MSGARREYGRADGGCMKGQKDEKRRGWMDRWKDAGLDGGGKERSRDGWIGKRMGG